MGTSKSTFTTPSPAYSIAKELPWLRGREKETVRLHPRRTAMPLPLLSSKAGGKIPWPDDEEWPHCPEHDLPFIAVLQLLREDVPELPFPEDMNLLQVLWCPEDHDECGYAPCATLFWRRS